MIGPENVGWRSVMSSSSSWKQVLVCWRVDMRVRTGIESADTLPSAATCVTLGGDGIGFVCRAGQTFQKEKQRAEDIKSISLGLRLLL